MQIGVTVLLLHFHFLITFLAAFLERRYQQYVHFINDEFIKAAP
jgi:hypothetical protein